MRVLSMIDFYRGLMIEELKRVNYVRFLIKIKKRAFPFLAPVSSTI